MCEKNQPQLFFEKWESILNITNILVVKITGTLQEFFLQLNAALVLKNKERNENGEICMSPAI